MSAWHEKEQVASKKRQTERESRETTTEVTTTTGDQRLRVHEKGRSRDPKFGSTTAVAESKKEEAERAARYDFPAVVGGPAVGRGLQAPQMHFKRTPFRKHEKEMLCSFPCLLRHFTTQFFKSIVYSERTQIIIRRPPAREALGEGSTRKVPAEQKTNDHVSSFLMPTATADPCVCV